MKNNKQFEGQSAGTKVWTTETHVYFLSGAFSNWHQSKFKQSLVEDGEKLTFNCGEQYMMAGKATLFGDAEHKKKIMCCQPKEGEDWRETPKRQKALGRDVEGFEKALYDRNAREIVFRGNWAKFTQNTDLLALLLATESRIIVEGASYDEVWGVKLNWNDPKILDEKNWRGTNWLGEVLMRVRDRARFCLANDIAFEDYNIWDETF
jgi:ribA/ribD-fused uncharacterized protein